MKLLHTYSVGTLGNALHAIGRRPMRVAPLSWKELFGCSAFDDDDGGGSRIINNASEEDEEESSNKLRNND